MDWEIIIEKWKQERFVKAFEPEIPFEEWIKSRYEPPKQKQIKTEENGNISTVSKKIW
jgi:hypothetical protein